jgi:hypothetical protein
MYGKIKDHITCAFCTKYKGVCVPITYEDDRYYRLSFPDGTSLYLLKENVELVRPPRIRSKLGEQISVTDRIDIKEEYVDKPQSSGVREKSFEPKVDVSVEEGKNDSSSEN